MPRSPGGSLRLEPAEPADDSVRQSVRRRRRRSQSRDRSSHDTQRAAPTTSSRFSPVSASAYGRGATPARAAAPLQRDFRRRASLGGEPAARREAPYEVLQRLRVHAHEEHELRVAAGKVLRDWFEQEERRHCPQEVAKRALVAVQFERPEDVADAYQWVIDNVDKHEAQADVNRSPLAPLWRWMREQIEYYELEPAPKAHARNFQLWADERVSQVYWHDFQDESETWGGPWQVTYTLGLDEGDFEEDDTYAYVNLLTQSHERRRADTAQDRDELLRCRLPELQRRAQDARLDPQAVRMALQGTADEAQTDLIELLLDQADDDLRVPRDHKFADMMRKAYAQKLECTIIVTKQKATGREHITRCQLHLDPSAQGSSAGTRGAPSSPVSRPGSPRRPSSPSLSDDSSGFLSPQQVEQAENFEASFSDVKSPEAKIAVVDWMVNSPLGAPKSSVERNLRQRDKCWMAWKLWVKQGQFKSSKKHVLEQLWRRWWRMRTAVFFTGWAQVTQRNQRWKVTMGRVALRWSKKGLASAFYSWQEYAQHKKKANRLVERSVRRMWQSASAAAFDRWTEYLTHERRKLSVVLHMANLFIGSMFTRWKQYTVQQKSLRLEHAALEDTDAAQKSLQGWKRREKRKMLRKFYKDRLYHWHAQAMEDCFHAWRRWHVEEDKRKKVKLQNVASAKEEAAKPSTTWLDSVRGVFAGGRKPSVVPEATVTAQTTASDASEDGGGTDHSVDSRPGHWKEKDEEAEERQAARSASPRRSRSRSPEKERPSRDGSLVRARSPLRGYSPSREKVGEPWLSGDESEYSPDAQRSCRRQRTRGFSPGGNQRRHRRKGRESRTSGGSPSRVSSRKSPSPQRPGSPHRCSPDRRKRWDDSSAVDDEELDEETMLIELEVEEELHAADNQLNLIETDTGSTFRRPARSPNRRQESSRSFSDDHNGSPSRHRHPGRRASNSNSPRAADSAKQSLSPGRGASTIHRTVSPATFPSPPLGYDDSPDRQPTGRRGSGSSPRGGRSPARDDDHRDGSPTEYVSKKNRPTSVNRHHYSPEAGGVIETETDLHNAPENEEEYAREMARRLDERLEAADDRRRHYAQTGQVRVDGGGVSKRGMSGARGADTIDRFSCKDCNWIGSSRTQHDRSHPSCRAVPVAIYSAGKVSPGFGTGSRFGTYSITSGAASTGNKFLHETKEDKRQRLLRTGVRGSPHAYSRTLGLSHN